MSCKPATREQWLVSLRRRIEPVGECMEWQGHLTNGKTPSVNTPRGYAWPGNSVGNQSVRSVLYALANGHRLPAGTVIRMKCWNERCVHEDHFQLIKRKDQSREQSKRGELNTAKAYLSKVRVARKRAKLSAAQVLDIQTSDDPRCDAAKRHGVSPQTVSEIRRGRMHASVARGASVFAWGRAA